MKVVFVTHNKLGLACIRELSIQGADLQAIYTRPQEREIADQTDLTDFSVSEGVPLHRVDSMNEDKVKMQLEEYEPDLLFVVGWSSLVDSEVLETPTITALGMHPAPLPRGRGRAPLAWSIIKGLDETALTLFHLEEEADSGDILGQESMEIAIEDDVTSLYDKVVRAGRRLIRKHYPEIEAGNIPRTPQNEAEATWWPERKPHHGLVDWTRTPVEIYDWIRGQSRPYPGAFSFLDDLKITFWKANPPSTDNSFVLPGEIAYCDSQSVGIGAWEGHIEVTEVQVEDDTPVPAPTLVEEYDFEIGDTFVSAYDRLQ